MKLKILSWNIWVDCHFGQFKKFIAETDADIIGLQEVRENDETRDVLAYMSSLGYQNVFASKQLWRTPPQYRFGPAVFSKYDIISSAIHLLSPEDPRCAVQADINADGTIVHAFSTHFSHTHQQPSKVQDEQVRDLLNVVPNERSIVMGDFNATPESSVIQRMTEALNTSDPSNAPTWSVYPEGCPTCDPQGIDTRLDYIFTTKDLRVSNPKVGQSMASDHLPITVEIEV